MIKKFLRLDAACLHYLMSRVLASLQLVTTESEVDLTKFNVFMLSTLLSNHRPVG